MIFYDCATAPSPRRARMVIAEKGLDIDTRQIDLRAGEQLGEAFRAINPRCTVPVLVTDDGTTLTENIAIAAYLEDIQPDPPLFGTSHTDRALVFQWNAIAEAQGGMAMAEALRNGSPAMAGRALPGPLNLDQIPELAVRGRKRIEAFKGMMDAHLADRDWIALDQFSYADLTTFVFLDYLRVIKMGIDEAHPNLAAFMERVRERPSAAA
ncbi:MAG: glutathione S-transferase family protein [Pseudomonadota bacterium]